MNKQLTEAQVAAMKAAMDKAMADFWLGRDAQWQMDFQADWLEEHMGTRSAIGPDGLVWGDDISP